MSFLRRKLTLQLNHPSITSTFPTKKSKLMAKAIACSPNRRLESQVYKTLPEVFQCINSARKHIVFKLVALYKLIPSYQP